MSANPSQSPLRKGGSLAWRWGPVVAWVAVIFWVSGMAQRPPTPGLTGVPWDDKLQHTAAYAILSALVWRALGAGVGGWFRAAIAILVAVGYGAFDECHQWFVPGRECALSDWSCDAAGAALAGVVLGVVSTRMGGGLHGKERRRGEDLRSQGQAEGEPGRNAEGDCGTRA